MKTLYSPSTGHSYPLDTDLADLPADCIEVDQADFEDADSSKTTRYSASTGCFYPIGIEYANLPDDCIEVPHSDFEAAMARPAGSTFAFVDGQLVITAARALTLDEIKTAKNDEINRWRETANLTSFPYAGKLVACDQLSRSDIDGVANHIGLLGTFPAAFPGAWKAMDNTYVPMPDIDTFKQMYAAMAAQGAINFKRAQDLKSQLATALTPADVDAIVWA